MRGRRKSPNSDTARGTEGSALSLQDRSLDRAIEVLRPARSNAPLIFASPHSGRRYPHGFLTMSRLDRHALRQSEDGYVDLLFEGAVRYGAPMLRALFPRAFVDVNRARNELDPRMFVDELPGGVDSRSTRVRAGLGVIPRIVADGHDIYGKKLRYYEARRRLSAFYDPYHDMLSQLIDEALGKYGCAAVIDCHSMPSLGGFGPQGDDQKVDFVLGDRYGSSCSGALTALAEATLVDMGYSVSRNAPYAGGYVASAYGRPENGIHVLQIEVNRALYLDERRLTRHDGFPRLRRDMDALVGRLLEVQTISLAPARAAE
ncbi:MAG: N-formylglutamate amidohydrolase [Pseudomonadota bacterium]